MRLGGKDTQQSARHHPLQARAVPQLKQPFSRGCPFHSGPQPTVKRFGQPAHTQLGRAHPESTCHLLGSLLARQENPPTGAPLTTHLGVSAFCEG